MTVDVLHLFRGFVRERHRVWLARQVGEPAPWTNDRILQGRKFTNVFRVLDYGSQFVLTELVDPSINERDQLARLFLYRHTGRVEAWQYLGMELGRQPLVADLPDVLEIWKQYRGEGKAKLENVKPYAERPNRAGGFQYQQYQRPVFTGAYLVFPQSQVPGTDKLESIVDLTQRLFSPSSDQDVVPNWLRAQTQAERFQALRRNKGVADFMSMQILTDWGYTPWVPEDREDEWVMPGPGAVKGAGYLDPQAKAIDVLYRAVKVVRSMPDCPYIYVNGKRRVPSLMDVQNCLCEFSKYMRYLQKPVPEQAYRPAHPGPQPTPVLPEAW